MVWSLRKIRWSEVCRKARRLRGKPYSRYIYAICCEKIVGKCYGRTYDICHSYALELAEKYGVECAKKYAGFEWQ